MENLYQHSRTAASQRLKRALICGAILRLLSDGQRRRSKDIAKELGIESPSLCTRILTGLHEIGEISRSEQPDPREPSGDPAAYFYRGNQSD